MIGTPNLLLVSVRLCCPFSRPGLWKELTHERLALSKDDLNTYGMPRRVQTSTYFSAPSNASSLDSSSFMPPNSTNGLSLAISIPETFRLLRAILRIPFCWPVLPQQSP